ALGTPKLWITLWFMLLVYYNFNIQGINKKLPYKIGCYLFYRVSMNLTKNELNKRVIDDFLFVL
ncbi:hypothetical protein Q7Y95_04565, partial [Glaesserella parasuis]|nr:hypothetical protein [Glaesserella parasuis]MDP0395042.1 hypothetical protein [Glaesserella parasuis]MDP0480409.1 hypothetical protein [Glaesserella parasuis]